jgi:hypothetical protein
VISDIWVDGELRLTFRRTFDERMMVSWHEVEAVVEDLVLSEESDALVWGYNSSGIYSLQSLYAIINYRGVNPVFVPAVWKINVPPKIQMFLWLLSHNKLATVDNLNKKGMEKHDLCVFCCEKESVKHLFFECAVARLLWGYVSEFFELRLGVDYISIASKWLNEKKWGTVNIISTAALRGILLTRNDFVFNGQAWPDVKQILRRVWKLSMEWKILCKESAMEMMKRWLTFLEQQRAVEDIKRMKFCWEGASVGHSGGWVL